MPDEQLPILLPPRERDHGERLAARLDSGVRRNQLARGAAARRGAKATRWTRSSNRRGTILRYLDPHNDRSPWDPQRAARWMNVDQYIGGAEHAVLHLLYSRFFYKFFHDRGWVSGTDEPFEHLFHQGLLLRDGEKMSKSRGNVVGIDETAKPTASTRCVSFCFTSRRPKRRATGPTRASADACGCSTASGAPASRISRTRATRRNALPAARRSTEKALLARGARRCEVGDRRDARASLSLQHDDRQARRARQPDDGSCDGTPPRRACSTPLRALPILIAPFAPHIAEELWERLGHQTSVHLERYLEPDERALAVDEITLVVQVNGKVRARIAAAAGVSEDEAVALALADTERSRVSRRQRASQAHLRCRTSSSTWSPHERSAKLSTTASASSVAAPAA